MSTTPGRKNAHDYKARLVWDGNLGEGTSTYMGYGRKYRPAFERLLADVAADTVWGQGPRGNWNRSQVKPTLEHYLGIPFDQMRSEFDAFCRQIAKEN